jgi:hypothetical protein
MRVHLKELYAAPGSVCLQEPVLHLRVFVYQSFMLHLCLSVNKSFVLPLDMSVYNTTGCVAHFCLKQKQAKKRLFPFRFKAKKMNFFNAFLHASKTLQKAKIMKAKHFKTQK